MLAWRIAYAPQSRVFLLTQKQERSVHKNVVKTKTVFPKRVGSGQNAHTVKD